MPQRTLTKRGLDLDEAWLNNGPSSIISILQSDWRLRLRIVYDGKALKLLTLGFIDLLGTKIDALCQRGDDFDDIIKMNPKKEALLKAVEWVKKQDGNPDWPKWVQSQAEQVARKLGYAI